MKIVLSLLLSVVFTILNVNAEIFINIVPHLDESCISTQSGAGFSAVIDTCFTFDYKQNHMFKHSNDITTLETFNSDGIECNPKDSVKQVSIQDGQCVQYAFVDSLNTNTNPLNKNGYYKISVSNAPYIPSFSVVNSFMSAQCFSDSRNAILYQYFTNGTVVQGKPNIGSPSKVEYVTSGTGVGSSAESSNSADNDNVLFYCTNQGMPMTLRHVITTNLFIGCGTTTPFYNSTYVPPSQTSTSGSASVSSTSSTTHLSSVSVHSSGATSGQTTGTASSSGQTSGTSGASNSVASSGDSGTSGTSGTSGGISSGSGSVSSGMNLNKNFIDLNPNSQSYENVYCSNYI